MKDCNKLLRLMLEAMEEQLKALRLLNKEREHILDTSGIEQEIVHLMEEVEDDDL